MILCVGVDAYDGAGGLQSLPAVSRKREALDLEHVRSPHEPFERLDAQARHENAVLVERYLVAVRQEHCAQQHWQWSFAQPVWRSFPDLVELPERSTSIVR